MAQVVGSRHFNASTPANYDYEINATILNGGTVDYTQDNWYVHFVLFNSPGIEGLTWDLPPQTINLLKNGGIPVVFHAHPDNFWNVSTYYCCAEAIFIPPDNSHNDNTEDDVLANNTLNLAMHHGHTVFNHVAAHNHRGAAIQFNVGVPDVPPGWTVLLNRSSLEIASLDFGYVAITVISPAEFASWPDFHVAFVGSTDHQADQDTHVLTRDDTIYATSCGEAVLL